jgi:sugar phosphate isomerase/epimerase
MAINILNIELSGGTKYSPDILDKLSAYQKKFSLGLLVHNYFPPSRENGFVLNIASKDNVVRSKSLQFVKTSIELAYELGIGHYTLHPGYATDLIADGHSGYFKANSLGAVSPEEAFSILLESLEEIEGYGLRRGIKIGLENLFPLYEMPGCSLLARPDEIFRFLDYARDSDNIGMLLDLGHLLVSAGYFGFDKDEFVAKLKEKYRDKIFEIHLSGNNGKLDAHSSLAADDWQLDVAAGFDLGKIPVVLECRRLNPEEISEQFKMVTDKLLQGNKLC